MRSVQDANEQVISQLKEQKWIDERLYVSCLPESRELSAFTLGQPEDTPDADAQFMPNPHHEKAKTRFAGLIDLKTAILSNKKMHSKPKKVILKNHDKNIA